MGQINDAILAVVGPQLNDGLVAHYQANGATSDVLNEAERQFLVFAGAAQAATQDMWMELLGPGHIDDLLLIFWEGGGTFTPPAVPPVWTTNPPNPPDGEVGISYNYNFQSIVDVTSVFTVTTGSIPAGLSLSSAGVLSGIPNTAETAVMQITATNAAGGTESLSFDILIAIEAVVWDTQPNPPDGQVGVAYFYDLEPHLNTSAGVTITHDGSSNPLPSGIVITGLTLTGTPDTVENQLEIGLDATNSSGTDGTGPFSIEIIAAGESLGPEQLTNGAFTGDGSPWTFQTGWSHDVDKARTVGNSAGNLFQGNVLTDNTTYRCTFDIPESDGNDTGNGLIVECGNGPGVNNQGLAGAHSIIVSSTTGSTIFRFTMDGNLDFRGTIDNVSLKEIL